MTEFDRYSCWKRDAFILIAGILEMTSYACALTSSSTSGLPQQASSSFQISTLIKASPAVTSYTQMSGLIGSSLSPSFSDSLSTYFLTSVPAWTHSTLASNYAPKQNNSAYYTGHNTSSFNTFSITKSSLSSSISQLKTKLNMLSTNTLFTGHNSLTGAYSRISSANDASFTIITSAMPVSKQPSLTLSHISSSRSSMFIDILSSLYPRSPLHSKISTQNTVNFNLISKSSSLASFSSKIFQTYPSTFSPVLQTTNYSSLNSSPAVQNSRALPSAGIKITSTKTTPTTPKHPVVIKPPPIRTVTAPTVTPAPKRCKTGSCCTYGLSQLPSHLSFEESRSKGFVLAEIRDVDVSFTVRVTKPLQLATFLKDSFNITASTNGYQLILNQEVDLEELYDQTDGKIEVHSLQLQITCSENSSFVVPPRMLNVTVEDVDDSMPVFSNTDTGSSDCVVPIYRADTSEDYMGELALRPGKIEAKDGDVTTRHNISYKVLHAEPADYHVYFNVDTENGTVHKTKSMNSSDPSKYVIFVQAVEDSPQQKSRVAVLSIKVVAPTDPFTNPNQVNPTTRLALQIACSFLLMAFICGLVVIMHHRYTLSRAKVNSRDKNEERDVKLPKLAVYQSSTSSLNSSPPEVPTISSPSQVVVTGGNTLTPDYRPSVSQKTRRLLVKKPLDPKLRPGWNAPTPRPKPTRYNPFMVYKKTNAN